MDLKVNREIHFIKKFTLTNLPNLIVITGKNGSGKTLLLNAINEGNHLSDTPHFYDDLGNPVYSAEVHVNSKLLKSISLVKDDWMQHEINTSTDFMHFGNLDQLRVALHVLS